MRQSTLEWYRLCWPREISPAELSALSELLATTGGKPVVVETLGRAGQVEHRVATMASHGDSLAERLRTGIPGLVTSRVAATSPSMTRAVELRLTTPQRTLRVGHIEVVSRAVITALGLARADEQVVLRWQLLAALPATSVASGGEQAEPLPASAADVLLGRRGKLDAEARAALRRKRELPVWRAVGHVAVNAASEPRERTLIRCVLDALRLANAPGVQVLARRCSVSSYHRVGRCWFAPLRLNTAEVAVVSGWPTGPTAALPVDRTSVRLIPPTRAIPSRGRILGVSTYPDAERSIALSVQDSLRHLHVVGPTGTGKSTLLLNAILQDIASGRGVVVIEPKGDLIQDVLSRVPLQRTDDVVLLDPSDDTAPVGVNPLASDGRSPELVADQLLGMFRSLYESSWGPRTNDILGASLLTLARTPGMTMCALPLLLGDADFRRRVVATLDDPIALEPFWATYEAWSESERTAATAPVLNKVRPFLLRPQLRGILGQRHPRFTFAQVYRERKILLVNLAKGAIGGEVASLLGSLVVSQLWAAALGRTNTTPERRRPTFVYIDEFQDYLHLPTDLADALAQARGLGIGFTLAHQHLNQLDRATRSAILANARSRVCFQLAAEDARELASGLVSADDLRELREFEVYAQVLAHGTTQPWCSARTLPASAPCTNPDEVRAASRTAYGIDRHLVEADIESLAAVNRGAASPADDLRPRRRQSGDAT